MSAILSRDVYKTSPDGGLDRSASHRPQHTPKMIGLLVMCTIGLVTGDVFKLQFDDTHYLYCDGTQLSTGDQWATAYTASTSKKCTSIAVFAQNTNDGPKGMMLTIDGQPTHLSAWKCKTVVNFAAANSQNAGWSERSYDTSSWGSMVTINGPWKSFEGGPWMWAQTGGNACICRMQLEILTTTVTDNDRCCPGTVTYEPNTGSYNEFGRTWYALYTTSFVQKKSDVSCPEYSSSCCSWWYCRKRCSKATSRTTVVVTPYTPAVGGIPTHIPTSHIAIIEVDMFTHCKCVSDF